MEKDRLELVNALTDDAGTPAKKSSSKFYLTLTIAICLLFVAGFVYSKIFSIVEVKTSRAVQVRGGGQAASLEAVGYVVARREANISSQVAGSITELLVEEGDYVEQDATIAKLDDSIIKRELILAESNLEASKLKIHEIQVRIEEAKLNLHRIQDMVNKEFVSQALLDEADAELKALSARLRSSQSDVIVANRGLELKKTQLEKFTIKAPFSGVVTSKHTNVGEMIFPGSTGEFTTTGLCTLTDMDSREIEVDVNEAYIERIFKEQAVEVKLDAYPDWLISATVINYVPTADRQKATVKVRIKFKELDEKILPDMGVRVKFFNDDYSPEKSAKSTIYIPIVALRKEQNYNYVWLVENEILVKKIVTAGKKTGKKIEILEGINDNDEVVVSRNDKLIENKQVKVING